MKEWLNHIFDFGDHKYSQARLFLGISLAYIVISGLCLLALW